MNKFAKLLCIVLVMVAQVPGTTALFDVALAGQVIESREIVFEHGDTVDYPNVEETFLKAIEVDFFIGNSGDQFHFPAKLYMTYDADSCYPSNSNFPVDFRIEPYDGAGLEYELERGFNFDVDVIIYDWGYKIGNDFEEDFTPPMMGESVTRYDPAIVGWSKGLTCIAGIYLAMYTGETFIGNEVTLNLQITEPTNTSLVKFKDTGTLETSINLTQSGQEASAILVIGAYPGTITLAAKQDATPEFIIRHQVATLRSGVGGWIHKAPWNCSPFWRCACYHTADLVFDWDRLSFEPDDDLIIEFDDSESDLIEFDLSCGSVKRGQRVNPGQDLAVRVDRINADTYPHPGGDPDTLEVRIFNIYASIFSAYQSIEVRYYLAPNPSLDVSDMFEIGVTAISGSDQRLIDFNAGSADTIFDTLTYNSGGPSYLFDKGTDWGVLDKHPRYQVRISPTLSSSAALSFSRSGSSESSTSISTDANDRAVAAFEPPIPDFSLDSSSVNCPPFLEFGDSLVFSVLVKNLGIDWPIPNTPVDPADSIMLRCQAIYERRSPDVIDVIQFEEWDSALVTPPVLSDDGDTLIDFVYKGLIDPPSPDLLEHNFPLHVRFKFDINGGDSAPVLGDWSVWERSFTNNTLECEFTLTDLPDLALPSGNLYSDGQQIEPSLPDVVMDESSQMRYLYVSDDSYPESGEPDSLIVEIGAGPYDTSPRNGNWNWYRCSYNGDMHDGQGTDYKVYDVDAYDAFSSFGRGYQSYCFRASQDWTFDHPDSPATYIYVDSDGTHPRDDSSFVDTDTLSDGNPYLIDLAGIVLQSGSWAPEYGYLTTSCWSVGVWNVPRAGTAHRDTVGNMMWFDSGLQFMYDNGLVVSMADDTTKTWFSIFDGSNSNVYFEAADGLAIENHLSNYEYGHGAWFDGDSVACGEIEYYIPIHPDTCVLIERITVCNCSDESQTFNIGEAIDWDVPDAADGSANESGVDEGRKMVYQSGPVDYPNPGITYCAGASACGDIPGAIVLENDEWVFSNSGYNPEQLGGLLARHTGFVATDSIEDLNSVYVLGQNVTLEPEECRVFCTFKAPSQISVADLQHLIDGAAQWIISNDIDCPSCVPCTCGDANGSDNVDIDDVVYVIDFIFGGGPAPIPQLCCGDANGSDGASPVDIDDVVYLITYIFGSGPEPSGCCE